MMQMESFTEPGTESACDHLSVLFDAGSIAILGASDNPTKISGRPLAYLLACGYPGKIYAVNPARERAQGLKSHPALTAIGEPVELAIIGTAAQHVEAIVQEGIGLGIKAFVVFSSGFAEMGEEGRAMQERLSDLARAHGIIILGPNCLGAANSRNGLIASFTTALESTAIVQGSFSFASQSGALGAYWLDVVLRSRLGFAKWVTTGNESDVDIAQALDHLVADENTRVIGLYIEDIRRPAAFRQALHRAACAGKPVLVIKAGRSAAGAAAAASHTGALAGDDALYDACFAQHGAIRVESLSEMMDMARLLTHAAVPSGRRLGVMSVSGGAGVLIADACEPLGLSLPAPLEPTRDALRAILPAFVHPANPLDITGNVLQDTSVISRTMETLAKADEVDAIVLFIGMMHSIADVFVDTLTRARQAAGCPIIVIWIGAMDDSIRQLEAHGIPVFLDIPQAISAIAQGIGAEARRAVIVGRAPSPMQGVVASGLAGKVLSEIDGKQLLRSQDAVMLPRAAFFEPSDKPGSAQLPPFPLVAKLQSADLLHKSDAGGVILGLQSADAIEAAVRQLTGKGRELGIEFQGVLVEEMILFDHELLLGLRRHSHFGPALTLARGGIEAELDPDAITRLLPLDENDIVTMLESLRCARLLKGFRGRPAANIPHIARRIAGLCDWFLLQPLAELEINPLAIKGSELWALDALITTGVVNE